MQLNTSSGAAAPPSPQGEGFWKASHREGCAPICISNTAIKNIPLPEQSSCGRGVLLFILKKGFSRDKYHLAQSARCYASACIACFASLLRLASSLHLAQSARCLAAARIACFASLLRLASSATGGASAAEPQAALRLRSLLQGFLGDSVP